MKSDVEAVRMLREKKVDIVMLFGFGAGNVTKRRDSETLMQSFFELIESRKPGILIIESSKIQDDKFHQVNTFLKKLSPYYSVTHGVQIRPVSEHTHAHFERLIFILEKSQEK